MNISLFVHIFVTTIISQTLACNRGWFGPSCAYNDLRYRSQKIVVDGDASNPSNGQSCVNLDPGTKSIDIEIDVRTPVFWIRATLRDEDSVSEFSLVFKAENGTTLECLEKKLVVDLRQIDVKCKTSEDWIKHVILRGSFHTTCDIFVSGGRVLTRPFPPLNVSTNGTFLGASRIQNCFDANSNLACSIRASNGDAAISITLPMPALLWSFSITSASFTPVSIYHVTVLDADAELQLSETYIVVQYLQKRVSLQQTMKTFILTHRNNRGRITITKIQLFGIFVCESGFYGNQCENECQCQNLTEKCFPETGGCPGGCSAGLRGLNCSIACPDFTFGLNCKSSCHNCNSSCDKVSGRCNSCKLGFYGSFCNKTCPKHCSPNVCSKVTGHCDGDCHHGYFGDTCNTKCCAGCESSQCEKATGNCRPCGLGYTGRNCCTECLPGRYGSQCISSCPSNCLYYACDWKNGTCKHLLCKAGFKGAKCEQECPSGTWGLNCNRTCSPHCVGECRHTNGYCQACKDDYLLPRCDALCPPGTYGENCKQKCPHCLHQPCNETDGRCPGSLCQAGWQREKCNTPCASGTWGINCTRKCSPNCVKLSQCRHVNGHCLDGCTKGFFPPLCVDTYLVCPDRTWGVTCERICSFHCARKGNCRRDNGSCLAGCVENYIPPNCQARKWFDPRRSRPSSSIFPLHFSTLFFLVLGIIVVVIPVCNCFYVYYMRKKDRRHNPSHQ